MPLSIHRNGRRETTCKATSMDSQWTRRTGRLQPQYLSRRGEGTPCPTSARAQWSRCSLEAFMHVPGQRFEPNPAPPSTLSQDGPACSKYWALRLFIPMAVTIRDIIIHMINTMSEYPVTSCGVPFQASERASSMQPNISCSQHGLPVLSGQIRAHH